MIYFPNFEEKRSNELPMLLFREIIFNFHGGEMQNWLGQLLKDALRIFATLTVEIVVLAFMYALLVTIGVDKDASLLATFIGFVVTMIGGTIFVPWYRRLWALTPIPKRRQDH